MFKQVIQLERLILLTNGPCIDFYHYLTQIFGMRTTKRNQYWRRASAWLALLISPALFAGPIFDTHLHYNAATARQFSAEQIISILARNNVSQALVTSTPPSLALTLHQQAPERILPLLGVYREARDKENWTGDSSLPTRLEKQLQQDHWCGIGELHLFARERHSPVFTRIIALAGQHELPLLLHTDPAVIDSVYEQAPHQPVIWAHAGTFPYPDLLADYLTRYPALHIDLSMRNERIAPNGVINDDWYELFIRFPNRFLVGVDTFSAMRWQGFAITAAMTREWLRQLPDDIARQIAHDNAAALFQACHTP